MQPVDLTTLRAVQQDLAAHWLPARVETLQQLDLWTLCLCLRTLQNRQWVLLSWHPQAARVHLCQPPPKGSEPFPFGQVVQRQLRGLALAQIEFLDPWERVLVWHFAHRPGEATLWRLDLEVMGRYSNAVLVNGEGIIVACGHGVSERQSRVRPVQPGLLYQPPPALTGLIPSETETLDQWQAQLTVIPGPIHKRLLQTYRGLSTSVLQALLHQVGIDWGASTTELSSGQWQALYAYWQEWIRRCLLGPYQPGWTAQGYTVLGWSMQQPVPSVHQLLDQYYDHQLHRERFQQERQRLQQKLRTLLSKLDQRRQQFEGSLRQSDQADEAKLKADLLMAYLHLWQPGLEQLQLPDFASGEPVSIPLDPEKNATQNAQAYYKQHRKQKRSREYLQPLWQATMDEIQYLEQVEAALEQLETYRDPGDLQILREIEAELIKQKYLSDPGAVKPDSKAEINFRRYISPNGLSIWVGRNNWQNDQLTFRLAQDQDLWFHAQEIPGSHVLLRLPPGGVPEESDLQTTANLAAYFSRARLSDQVPVVYTHPTHVYKPKGSRPGMVIYKHETVIWAQPQAAALATAQEIHKENRKA